MELKELLEEISSAEDPSALIREAKGMAGFSREYFNLVHNAFGRDPRQATRLAGAWPQLLRYGDEAAFAYRTRAVSERMQGRWLDSARSFVKAGSVASNAHERLSFQVGAVDSLARGGRVEEAVHLGRKLSRGLAALGEPALAGRVKLNVGNALLWADRYREAMKWLTEALAVLEQPESIFAKLGLSTANLYGGNPLDAGRIAGEAAQEAAAAGFEYASLSCEVNVAQSLLMVGRADDALQRLLELRPRFEGSPADMGRIHEFLGDAYLRLNLWQEAGDAYSEALSSRRALPALNVAACQLGIGQANVAAGRPDSALEPLKGSAKTFRRCGNTAWAAAAKTWTAKALHSQGKSALACRMASQARSDARAAKSRWHEIEAALTHAEIGGEVSLAAVGRSIRSLGYASQSWRIPAIRATTAPPSRKLAAHRRAFEAILANRVLTDSAISRSAYFQDKAEHISAYIATLLGNPTPDRVREAVDAISRSRSLALLDEILASRSNLTDEQVRDLEGLRVELEAFESEGRSPGGSRRQRENPRRIRSLQRRWIEASHALTGAAAHRTPSPSAAATAILTQAGGNTFVLRCNGARRLPITDEELRDHLRWLRFELLAPMAERNADPKQALEEVQRLATKLVAPWLECGSEELAISPEGQLWEVPWTTCVQAVSMNCEPVLALHPRMSVSTEHALDREPTAALWVAECSGLAHVQQEENFFLNRFPGAHVCHSAREAREFLQGNVDVLHVVGHGRHNASNPMFSAIDFRDGALYAAEIARSGFRTRLVTLSACETGCLRVALREEPDGLARAFLACGAQAVVGSLWPLDDEAAFRFFSALYEALDDRSIVAAMRAARERVRRWNPHPYFWGAPALFGGYAA